MNINESRLGDVQFFSPAPTSALINHTAMFSICLTSDKNNGPSPTSNI